MSYYIKREAPHGTFYWTGDRWDRNEAKGYSSKKRAQNTAQKIIGKVLAFEEELTVERS
jgi:hypothetical protein